MTHDLEVQENKEVLEQSDTDQTRRWSHGNGIGSSIPQARENPSRIQDRKKPTLSFISHSSPKMDGHHGQGKVRR